MDTLEIPYSLYDLYYYMDPVSKYDEYLNDEKERVKIKNTIRNKLNKRSKKNASN